LLNFLKRTRPAAEPSPDTDPRSGDSATDDVAPSSKDANGASILEGDDTGAARDSMFAGKTSADFEPLTGAVGEAEAEVALGAISRAPPRSISFVLAPRTLGHEVALRAALTRQASALSAGDALVLACDFADHANPSPAVDILRLPPLDARRFARGIARAVEMLAVTLPAAFESDHVRVARLTLDEELRSGHDGAIEGLKRRAYAQNVGILRTPLGYTVAPMHEGRVVQANVFKSLPEGLRGDVETKLALFEHELEAVLGARAELQQNHRARVGELEAEVAGLAVRAALAELTPVAAPLPDASRALASLEQDLIHNAALFLDPNPGAGRGARAPAEIAADPKFARYRVTVIAPGAGGRPPMAHPERLDSAGLAGVATQRDGQLVIVPGALVAVGQGLVAIDARDLIAVPAAWRLIKRALAFGFATPKTALGLPVVSLPVDARIVISGDEADFRALAAIDPDLGRRVQVIGAFDTSVLRTPGAEAAFARHITGRLPRGCRETLDGDALQALVDFQQVGARETEGREGAAHLSTDFDGLAEVLAEARTRAATDGRPIIGAHDVAAALAVRHATVERISHARPPWLNGRTLPHDPNS
jgi:predicted ATP-dependent protease